MHQRSDPHADASVLHAGAPVAGARLVVILLHGRGASAEDILGLSREVRAADVAFLAPQAAGHTWYPQTFLAPIQENEPSLTSALRLIATSIDDLANHGVPAERVALMGFSQGACLSLEFVARHARRYAAVAALSGGLIGPPGTPRDYSGSLDGTPVFIGCSDVDAHIPLERVHESTTVLRRLGAAVDERIYPGMGHTITRDELDAVNALLAGR
ncbi:MAG TPA: dienelactone hydrolase family protein [Vicinamibacterales bacterium]|jgi:predicted esterase|nr:dienelactone hydrolase family protein [Vicinamibacterales bacterium]